MIITTHGSHTKKIIRKKKKLPNQLHIRLSVDAVVFGYDPKDGIALLLIQRGTPPYQGDWALPGGQVRYDESLETAVQRELKEETNVHVNYLEQLYTYGAPDRDPRNRVVSVAYYGLVRQSNFQLYADTDAADARWFNIKKLPKLAFDHDTIVATAIERLKNKIFYEPIGFELLDEKFPFGQLHKLYEAVKDDKIDRRNFRKKMLQLGILEELKEKHSDGRGRPGSFYRFKQKEYFKLKEEGMVFEV